VAGSSSRASLNPAQVSRLVRAAAEAGALVRCALRPRTPADVPGEHAEREHGQQHAPDRQVESPRVDVASAVIELHAASGTR
jgi:hypothetical protein